MGSLRAVLQRKAHEELYQRPQTPHRCGIRPNPKCSILGCKHMTRQSVGFKETHFGSRHLSQRPHSMQVTKY